ncbi:cupredoxin domain-containing protein [Sporichthya sp.]|uniref:cupredoxin domain-containing protein n=1 Tax=Sporichthya sp. TaxID=65475 RepID=UPI001793A642|nr:cupredoxin domain-containing protein [Sporichthya sp.]MBA3745387.1 cupredoxin domain-containing protein [Sporichthya sp.]
MKFRTQLAAVAAVAMLVGLAACGGGDDEASSGTSTTTDTSGAAATPDAGRPAGSGSAAASMITMKDNTFSPADLTVAPGASIMVMNAGTARHDLKDKDSNGKAFASGDLDGGKDGSITAPAKAGDYPYKCTYHFGMEGTLHVK